MKNLFCMALSLCFFTAALSAQDMPTYEDYERYVESKLEMKFRTQAIETAGFTEEEILLFDPIFKRYTKEKQELLKDKMNLIASNEKKMMDDKEFISDKEEDFTDFIEDYMEVEVKEMKLSKNYFDLMENKIAKGKVFKFFMFENAIQNRIKFNELAAAVPNLNNLEQMAFKTAVTTSIETRRLNQQKLAAKKEVTGKDYQKYIDSKLEMDFRNESLKMLALNKKETEAFDSVFKRYMAGKERLLEKKMYLIEDIKEEMMEDDDKENQEEDVTDFIEDFWEVEIEEKELSLKYFDILEGKIPGKKAVEFFLWESAVQNYISSNRLASMIPSLMNINSIRFKDFNNKNTTTMKSEGTMLSRATKQSVSDFQKWVTDNRGKVDKSHEYTSNGLRALATTFDALKKDMKINFTGYDKNKQIMMSTASEITADYKKTDHADKTRNAFMAVSSIMGAIKPASKDSLFAIANQLKGAQLMTKQANTVYQFFDEVSKQLGSVVASDASMKR